MDPAMVLALVTELGGPTSHTAILASQLGIPAVVHVSDALSLEAGRVVAVDGASGVVITDPDAELQAEFAERTARRRALLADRSGPGRLRDGTAVALYANVGTVADAKAAAAADVEGVGLFRTEFLFGDRPTAPSLAEQTDAYATVFQAFGSRPVTIRTLDAGADKPMRFAPQDEEANVSAVRLSLALHDASNAARWPPLPARPSGPAEARAAVVSRCVQRPSRCRKERGRAVAETGCRPDWVGVASPT